MNEAPPNLPDDQATRDAGWDVDDGLPLEAVRELFVTLGKALRAVQLYDENNPVYQRFVSSLREAVTVLWSDLDRLSVTVDEGRLLVSGEEVYRSDSRSDSLAFLFFKDGIREVTFLPGIEDELERFLRALQKARRVRGEGDDLVTILWEEDLEHLRYHYVDLLAEGVELPEPGEGSTAGELQRVLDEELDEPDTAEATTATDDQPPPSTVSQEDFNPTLYAFDARELEQIRTELRQEMERDLRADVLAALFDRLEERERPERQSEVLGVLGTLLPNFLGRGAIGAAAGVLEELSGLERREGVFDDERRAELQDLLDRVSAPETMQELVRALEDGTLTATPGELGELLEHLRPGALAPLLKAAELTEIRELEPVIHGAVERIAGRNREAVTALLRDDDPVVVAGAARLAGRMKIEEAGPALARLMSHRDAGVRLAAVEAAASLRASTAAGALQGVLTDPDREVRIAAARALGELRYRPAARVFREVVTGKDIRGADLTEQIAFFESYGDLGDTDAVGLMDKLLNGRGFLGRREPAEIRACAALALGRIGTPDARRALNDALSEDDAVVRSAVNRALRGEGSE